MSAETSLYSLLSGAAGVTALVSTRIYPDVLPVDAVYPSIAFSRANSEPTYSLGGVYYGTNVELSIGCWSDSRTSADAVALAVRNAIPGSAFVHTDGPEAAYDPATHLFASTITVAFFEV